MTREWQQSASTLVPHAVQGFDAQFQIAFGENPLDGALLQFPGEFENGAQDRATRARSGSIPLVPFDTGDNSDD